MIDKKRLLLMSKIGTLVLILLIGFAIIPITISKYQSSGSGNINSNIAFYLLKDGYYQESVKLSDVDLNKSPYVVNFSVANKKENKVSDVDIEYVVKVITTTNLPFTYELYENEDYQGGTNLINAGNTVVEKDSDGTYFQTFSLDKEVLYFNSPNVNNYTLLVYFGNLKDAKYQDVVESVRIVVDSRQVIE